MADRYLNFAALAATEQARAFHVFVRDLSTSIVIAAPHGGEIEPGTSEIARAIAGDDLSLYLFEGIKEARNRDLHITSTRFDEPRGMLLFESAMTVLTVHGAAGSEEVAYVGGRDEVLGTAVLNELQLSGFNADRHEDSALQGLHPRNICNLGRKGEGVQLELSRGLRKLFFESLSCKGRHHPTPLLAAFSAAIRTAVGPTCINEPRR